jgi:aminopeptidase-like protein
MQGEKMYALATELFPICRSITGNGVRETFEILKRYYEDIKLYEVPTGTEAFDWTVPKEWNITGGYLEDSKGNRIVDFADSNLHVLGYSTPIDTVLSLEELEPHLYTLPNQPDLIPYATSYYVERWGFCMTQKQKDALKPGNYHAVIQSELKEGSLTYGEIIIPGETKEEIFLSTYICHPSMANNECSGPALMVFLADWIKNLPKRKYTYRIILVPETIGAITYLSRNLAEMKRNIIAGFNITCVGDNRSYSLVRSRYGDTLADRVMKNVLKYHYPDFKKYSYLKRGSDERQYQAPGVDLPVVCFCRSKYHEFPEYHTSADNLDFISPAGFQGSFDVLTKCIQALEYNENYQVTCLCEPQLGKRGLIPTVSNKETSLQNEAQNVKNIVGYADGRSDLIDLSDMIKAPIDELIPIIDKLLAADLLRIV